MTDYLKIIVAMLIWSTWGPMIRWLALPPVVVLFSTSLIASFTVPAFLKMRGEFSLSGIRAVWWILSLLAIASITNNISYFYALAHTTVSNAVFTHYTAPIFVALLAPMMLSERIQRETMISLPLAVCGMTLIVLAGDGLKMDGPHTAGIIAGTISGVAYAFIILYSRQLSRMMMHHKAVVMLPWITTLVTAPAVFLADFPIDLRTVLLLVVTGIFHSTLAPLLYYNALRKVMAQHAAILGYMEPLAAVPMAFFLLSETPSFAALFGGALILLSGYIVIHSRFRK
jgi:drug/metabolite transporter (DMT)-like permease